MTINLRGTICTISPLLQILGRLVLRDLRPWLYSGHHTAIERRRNTDRRYFECGRSVELGDLTSFMPTGRVLALSECSNIGLHRTYYTSSIWLLSALAGEGDHGRKKPPLTV